MSIKRAFVKSAKINELLSVEITVAAGHAVVEWTPEPPAPGSLTRSELEDYFAARGGAWAEWATATGQRMLMLDTNGRARIIGPDGIEAVRR